MKVLTFFLIVVGIGLLGFFWLAIAGLLTYFWWLPIALELVALGVYLQVKYSKTAIKTMGIVSWVAAFLLLIIFLPYEALERRSSNRVFGAVSETTPVPEISPTPELIPVFGKTTIGGTVWALGDNKWMGKFTLSEDGFVVGLRFYGKWDGTGSTLNKGFIYADSGGIPGALKGTTNEINVDSTTAQWWTLEFPSAVSLPAGAYWLGILAEEAGTYVYYDSGGTSAYYTETYSTGPIDPCGSVAPETIDLSIYAARSDKEFDYSVLTPEPQASPRSFLGDLPSDNPGVVMKLYDDPNLAPNAGLRVQFLAAGKPSLTAGQDTRVWLVVQDIAGYWNLEDPNEGSWELLFDIDGFANQVLHPGTYALIQSDTSPYDNDDEGLAYGLWGTVRYLHGYNSRNMIPFSLEPGQSIEIQIHLGVLEIGVINSSGLASLNTYVDVSRQSQDTTGNKITGRLVARIQTDQRGIVSVILGPDTYMIKPVGGRFSNDEAYYDIQLSYDEHKVVTWREGETGEYQLPTIAADPVQDGRIVFVSDRDGNWEIYVMNADGSGRTNLTNNPAADYDSTWSPDGTKIAFISDRDGNWEIYVMNADGSGQTRLTNNPANDHGPTWSPDGAMIAFVSDRDGNKEIYIMNADGSGQMRLTNNASIDMYPSWGREKSVQ